MGEERTDIKKLSRDDIARRDAPVADRGAVALFGSLKAQRDRLSSA